MHNVLLHVSSASLNDQGIQILTCEQGGSSRGLGVGFNDQAPQGAPRRGRPGAPRPKTGTSRGR